MRRSIDDWMDDVESRPVVTGLKVLFGFLALAVLIAVGLWFLGVVASPWQGKGDAKKDKNSAANWIAAQRGFHQEREDVTAFQAKIATARQDLQAFEQSHPSNGTPYDPNAQQAQNLRTTLTGLQQQCVNTVATYNTDAQSYLTEDWRDADLPDHLDPAACR
jgi:hypothetical protein